MNQSRSQKEPMSRKAKLYWAIGIVIVILVAALLIWHNFFYGNKNAVAATVGDHEYTTTEVAYYYNSVANNYISQAQQYSQLGMDMGYDTSLSPSEQTYNEEEGTTYADYFLQQALDQLQRVTILCDAAEQEGYTLSEEGQQSVEDNMDALYTYSEQSGAGSEESYLRMIYGRNMTKSLFEEMLTNAILADEYAQSKSDSFTYSDEDLETYYEELGTTLGEALLAPTRIYVKALKAVKNAGVTVKACSHITGGGFYENVPRMLKDGVRAVIKKDSYQIPPIFGMLAKKGDIEEHMMYNTYNMGIGMVVAVDAADAERAMEAMKSAGDTPYIIGSIEAGEKGVTLC